MASNFWVRWNASICFPIRFDQHPHIEAQRDDLPSLGQSSTTKDIDGIIGDISSDSSRLHLEESNLSSQILGLLLVVLAVLVRDQIQSGRLAMLHIW
jgi:hypothetical protein